MIFIVAKFTVRPEYSHEWLERVSSFTQATRREPGNLWFEWSRSLEHPDEFVLLEAFRDGEAGVAHERVDDLGARSRARAHRADAAAREQRAHRPLVLQQLDGSQRGAAQPQVVVDRRGRDDRGLGQRQHRRVAVPRVQRAREVLGGWRGGARWVW